MNLSDGTIFLRRPTFRDKADIFRAVRESLPELQPWMDWATEAYSEASAQRWLEFANLAWDHHSAYFFVIIDVETSEYLGNCSLDGIQNLHCNLGYWVRTARTKQGIASRAIQLAAKFAFHSLGMERVEILIAAENLASQRAAQKAGGHFSGAIKNGIVIRQDVWDAVLYSFTGMDFPVPPYPPDGSG